MGVFKHPVYSGTLYIALDITPDITLDITLANLQ
jgi:hypothetical protein